MPRSGSGTQHKKCPQDTMLLWLRRFFCWVPERHAPEAVRSFEDDERGGIRRTLNSSPRMRRGWLEGPAKGHAPDTNEGKTDDYVQNA